MKTILATLALIAPLLAGATSIEASPACFTSPANTVNCSTLVNDSGATMSMQRYTVPAKYPTPAQSFIEFTIGSVTYKTLPNGYTVDSTLRSGYPRIYDQAWTFTAYTDGGSIAVVLKLADVIGTCSGRGCQIHNNYTVLGGTVTH